MVIFNSSFVKTWSFYSQHYANMQSTVSNEALQTFHQELAVYQIQTLFYGHPLVIIKVLLGSTENPCFFSKFDSFYIQTPIDKDNDSY